MAMCPRQHKRDILAQTSSGGEVLIFHNPRLAHRRKPWLLVALQNVSRLQACVGASAAKRVVRVVARGLPVNHATSRSTLMAVAIATCCKCVLPLPYQCLSNDSSSARAAPAAWS